MTRRVEAGDGPGAFETLRDDPFALVTIWDPITGERVAALAGPGEGVKGLAISQDGTYVAATVTMGRAPGARLLVWELRTRKLLAQTGYPTRAQGVAFVNSGDKIAVSVSHEVHIVSISH